MTYDPAAQHIMAEDINASFFVIDSSRECSRIAAQSPLMSTFYAFADVAGAMGSWRDHVAMLVSNRSKGWTVMVAAIGDALLSQGHVADAHFWCVSWDGKQAIEKWRGTEWGRGGQGWNSWHIVLCRCIVNRQQYDCSNAATWCRAN